MGCAVGKDVDLLPFQMLQAGDMVRRRAAVRQAAVDVDGFSLGFLFLQRRPQDLDIADGLTAHLAAHDHPEVIG
ncbi:hypothetical protein G6F50_018462 [Rhizopus delemar]|uniref:Uncharacterized protein n=1 Tax=Rhizopus delemar TaxID=936053 RepID=A0A9P6XM53_9FUNG|nr:hypothetical protein G6F50_018462 [Rhizopus delemar]